jgi:hypothetical protein
MKKSVPKEVLAYLREIGSKGGKNRADNSTPAQRKKWASLGAKFGKLGGRPKNKKAKGGTK